MGARFDTAGHASRLQCGGVPVAQAQAHVQAFNESLRQALAPLASNVALHELEVALRAELRVVEATLRAEIVQSEAKLRTEIGAAEARLRGELRDLRAGVDSALVGVRERLQLLQWMVGVLVAGVGGLLLRAYG